jgi:hypothetical protein
MKTVKDVMHDRQSQQRYKFSGAIPRADGTTEIDLFCGVKWVAAVHGKSPEHAMLRAIRLRGQLK